MVVRVIHFLIWVAVAAVVLFASFLTMFAIVATGAEARAKRPRAKPAVKIERAGTTASWYHEGLITASGTPFNPDGETCAHRTLPLGTVVLVTHAGNGLSVTCLVDDRGPAAWTGHEIDLSRGAARRIEILQSGWAKVTIKVLRHPDHPWGPALTAGRD